MIGSHDSFTYMTARNPLVNVFKGLWRTQSKSIETQYKSGVRFFDIRLFRDGNEWRAAHGVAEFGMTYKSLSEAAKDFVKMFPCCRFQIWMEKGTDEDWELFRKEADVIIGHYKWALTQVVRKNPETVYHRCENYPKVVDYSFRDWTWKNILRGLRSSPIRQWAIFHNPVITEEQRADRNTIYFMDYV